MFFGTFFLKLYTVGFLRKSRRFNRPVGEMAGFGKEGAKGISSGALGTNVLGRVKVGLWGG